MLNWIREVLDRSHVKFVENKESSVNTQQPSVIPIQAQEQRRTWQDSKELLRHIEKQLKSHTQNNAMLMHKGDCDIFTCHGCDQREPDKIVSEVYEVKDTRVKQCSSRNCRFPTVGPNDDVCLMHEETKCSVGWCVEPKEEGMPDRSDLCMVHYREHQMYKWSGDESRNPDQT
jgi:hypothetical protein